MLKREIIDHVSKNRYNVSFFEDDSIETIRNQIAKSLETHPDRLLIFVALKLPGDYYAKDPRRWEYLFERISYNGEPLAKETFETYQQQYRSPNLTLPFGLIDRSDWMGVPDDLRELYTSADFIEYRIFGVEESKSFILPLDSVGITSKIPAARLPIPENTKLISSLYKPDQIARFMVKQYKDDEESTLPVYFPFFRSTTPTQLTVDTVSLLNKNSKLLNDLLTLKKPSPSEISIIRTRFYIPWVSTDFGDAIRTRFEQIFYGLTVSKDTPYIGIFTSKEQVSRHKFFVQDSKDKQPYLDMTQWNTWWSLTKPLRNIPTVLLYRGKSKHNFDRIAITQNDMIISTYRSDESKETIDELKDSLNQWLITLDSIIPFIDEKDIDFERWELQDLSYVAKYTDNKIDDFDLLRFNCISSIFDIADKSKSQFSLLRTDHSNHGVSATEVKIIQMFKESPALGASDVAEELMIPLETAKKLLTQVENRLDEEPKLSEKIFRGYPTLRIGPEYVIVSSVSELERSLEYSNILRYILSNPDSPEVQAICPKRMERVAAETAVVPTTDMELDATLVDEYSDLFGYLEQEDEVSETISLSESSTAEPQRISTEQRKGTIYSYFADRMREFDPITFDPAGSKYPKICEQKHQPIILSIKDQVRLKGTAYDVKNFEDDKKIDIENPDGTIICPEYWCMKDQIPLQESQLENETGELRCPECKGKLQTRTSDDPREFPLVKRESGHVYPGYKNYKSPKNGKDMPCCFVRSRAGKNIGEEKANEDKYYVLNENKTAKPFRVSFLTESLINSLYLNEKYELLKGSSKRLQNSMSGFFRVGLGKPSENLSTYLNLKTKIPSPRESIDTLLKCSFFRSWNKPSTKHEAEINNALKKIEPYDTDDIVRENLVPIVAGIDEAYHNNELLEIQELEYVALFLQCDVFRIYTETNKLGCLFYTPMVRPRSRGIVVLQNSVNEIDLLSYVTRLPRGFEYRSNVFDVPFKKDTYSVLEKLRNESCTTSIPSYDDALKVIQQLLPELGVDDYSIILDPFGRGQALYVPDKLILPFQSTPLPDVAQTKIAGYNDVKLLPSFDDMKLYLDIASRISSGYEYSEDIFNSSNQRVEILVKSGLRILVKPEVLPPKENLEVMETVQTVGETEIAFGKTSKELKSVHDEISYKSEVYDFLIFQLTKDLESDYAELRTVLRELVPKVSEVQPLLQDWFTKTVTFNGATNATKFLSKIRTPCGQFKENECSGNLCGWDGRVCRIQIKESLQKDSLFHRLLSSLVENSKIRSMVLDGRTTPFFSTILYLELPHELIVTDNEIPE
jgi:hypothetical protein